MLNDLFTPVRRFFEKLPAHGDHGAEPTADPIDLEPEPPSLSIDAEGWLMDETPDDEIRVVMAPSPRSTALHKDTGGKCVGIVWHWTGTVAGTAPGLAKRIAKPVAPGERASSWHILIARNGTIYQSVSLKRGSWSAGGPTAARFNRNVILDITNNRARRVNWEISPNSLGTGPGANPLFVGVELENVGEVKPVNGKWYGWPFLKDGAASPEVAPHEVTNLIEGKRYQAFTEHQVASAEMFCRAFHAWAPDIHRKAFEWGHRDIDPSRKTDPGPAWANDILPRMLDRVFGG